jgi:hypothetical protein
MGINLAEVIRPLNPVLRVQLLVSITFYSLNNVDLRPKLCPNGERLFLAGSLSQQEKHGSRVQMFKLDTARHYHMTLQPGMFLRGCYYA